MSSICAACELPLQGSKFIACACCIQIFHCTPECTKLTAIEVNALGVNKPALEFKCLPCKANGGIKIQYLNSLETITKALDLLRNSFGSIEGACATILNNHSEIAKFNKVLPDIATLKKDVAEIKNRPSIAATASASDINVWEIKERIRRENNIIVYNIVDINDSSSDTQTVNNALQKLSISVLEKDIKRIGEFKPPGPDVKARPLLICLGSSDLARKVKKFSPFPAACQVSFDRTKLERQELKAAYNELDERKAKGEKNLCVSFINGTPTVAPKPIRRSKRTRSPHDADSDRNAKK